MAWMTRARSKLLVSSVTLAELKWVAATDALPARCEVDGRMAPVDAAPTARAINFRVWLPAEWNRRAAQQGGGGMNGSIPDLRGGGYAIDGRSPAQWGFVTYLLLGLLAAGAFAWLSWHLIEEPALRLRHAFSPRRPAPASAS